MGRSSEVDLIEQDRANLKHPCAELVLPSDRILGNVAVLLQCGQETMHGALVDAEVLGQLTHSHLSAEHSEEVHGVERFIHGLQGGRPLGSPWPSWRI